MLLHSFDHQKLNKDFTRKRTVHLSNTKINVDINNTTLWIYIWEKTIHRNEKKINLFFSLKLTILILIPPHHHHDKKRYVWLLLLVSYYRKVYFQVCCGCAVVVFVSDWRLGKFCECCAFFVCFIVCTVRRRVILKRPRHAILLGWFMDFCVLFMF